MEYDAGKIPALTAQSGVAAAAAGHENMGNNILQLRLQDVDMPTPGEFVDQA
jgi:hypothetical protein